MPEPPIPEDIPATDSPLWEIGLRSLLYWKIWQQQEGKLTAEGEAAWEDTAEAYYQSDPDRFMAVTGELGADLPPEAKEYIGLSTEGDITQALINFLGAPTATTTTGRRVTVERRARYIDIPTEEGWLAGASNLVDSFTRSFLGYISEMRQGGQLVEAQATWLRQNIGEFYSAYQAELAKRAEAGELEFGVTGIPKDITELEKVGVRPGEIVSQDIESYISSIEQRLADPEGLTPEQVAQLKQTSTRMESMKEEFWGTEELITRPRLEVTMGYTPTEFLKEFYDEGALKARIAAKRPTTRPGTAPGAIGAGGRPRRI